MSITHPPSHEERVDVIPPSQGGSAQGGLPIVDRPTNGKALDAMRIDTLRTRARHLRHLAAQTVEDFKVRSRLEGRAEAFETLAADMEAGTW